VPVKALIPSQSNVRHKVTGLDELVQSIKSSGIVQPLVVVPNGKEGQYEVVAGNRRLAAAKEAGLDTVPVVIRLDLSESGRLELQLIENLQREDLSPIEEAESYQRLLDVTKLSQRELAPRIGRSQGLISKRLSLLRLPESLRKKIESGSLTLANAEEIARLSDEKDMESVARAIDSDPLMPVRSAVDRISAEEQRTSRVRKAQEAAKKKGIKVVPLDDVISGEVAIVADTDEAMAAAMMYAEEYVPVSGIKDHDKLDCSAVTVDENGTTFPVCLRPEEHEGYGDEPVADVTDLASKRGKTDQSKDDVVSPKTQPGEKPQEPRELSPEEKAAARRREKEAAEAKALKTAREGREQFMASLLQGRLPAKAETVNRVIWGFIQRAGAGESKSAVKLLGIEYDKPAEGWQESMAAEKALLDYAAKNDDSLLRVGLALALAVGEGDVNFAHNEAWQGNDVRHMTWLEERGYSISPIEAKRLGRKASGREGKAPTKSTAKSRATKAS
jgi:ParB family chromosome partitioning protein